MTFAMREGNSLQAGGFADIPEAERDAMEARVDFRSVSGEGDSLIATMSCPENIFVYRQSHHSQFRHESTRLPKVTHGLMVDKPKHKSHRG